MLKNRLILGLLLLFGAVQTMQPDCCSSSCNTSCSSTSCCDTSCGSSCSTGCSTGCNTSCDNCKCPGSSHTFFFARPLYQSARPELISTFRNDVMIMAEDGFGGALDFVIFGGRSTKPGDLAKYFLPYCRQALVVDEATNLLATPNTGNIQATNFGIHTVNGNFQSTISFAAHQDAVGLGIRYKQGFWFNDERTKWWYLDINAPITSLRNTMKICETVANNGGGVTTATGVTAVANMTEAFNQASWCYGKINNCGCKKVGLADIEFKLGYQWFWQECCHIASYFGVLIPTGNAAKGRYVFEPIIGHGGSAGLMWGSEGGYRIWSNCDETWHLNFEGHVHSQYLFSKRQTRSFDLKNKPWSRYQEVYLDLAQAQAAAALGATPAGEFLSTPGINVFTKCVNVTPGFQLNATTALVLSHDCGFEGELGYNFFARDAECVKLKGGWVTGPALKAAIGQGFTNPIRNITPNPFSNSSCLDVALANYSTSLIEQSDLDLQSAAHPSVLIQLLYGTLGYRWNNICMPTHLTFGASYEFGDRSYAVMNRWNLWGKVGFAF